MALVFLLIRHKQYIASELFPGVLGPEPTCVEEYVSDVVLRGRFPAVRELRVTSYCAARRGAATQPPERGRSWERWVVAVNLQVR